MFRQRTAAERFWEIIPGLQLWSVFIGALLLSYFKPTWAAVFIICFDIYWILKAINVASHLISSYKKFRACLKIDWLTYVKKLDDLEKFIGFLRQQKFPSKAATKFIQKEIIKLEKLQALKKNPGNYEHFFHLILIPFVSESYEVLNSSIASLAGANYPKDKLILLLAAEERAGENALKIADQIKQNYSNSFYKIFITVHPDGLPGEIKGKSANASYAVESILPELKNLSLTTDQILVSNFDSDTVVHPQYFARVMYEFLTAEKPYQTSYQPIAIYNNNIWDTPAIVRLVSVSNSFWQFSDSSRPDRLRTFSSHTMTLKALMDIGFWKKDIVNEDGFVYWQCYLHYNGDYKVAPLFIPVSLDTCLAETTWQTLKNQYKQKRRWAYNVEYWPHLIWPVIKSKAPLHDKVYKLFQYWEQNFHWATASIMIATLGWLPLVIGGNEFINSVAAFNLPTVTKTLMNIALLFLIISVYINFVLLPKRPAKYGKWKTVSMYLQWFFVPVSEVVFGSLPAVEAQTRLMFGKYLEFWVTPKARKGEHTGLLMKGMGKN